MSQSFRPGTRVIYHMPKFSTHPGPRAHDVHPAPHGDSYNYVVDKFWVVDKVLEDGRLLLRTRKGKTHIVRPDDPNLQKASLWTRWRYRNRFPAGVAQDAQ